MFKQLHGAVERIAFQANSRLARQLVQAVELVVADIAAKGAPVNEQKLLAETDKLKTFREQVAQIVLRETGLTVVLHVEQFYTVNACMWPVFNKDIAKAATLNDLLDAFGRMAGERTRPPAKTMKDVYDRLEAALDLKTGMVDPKLKDVFHIEICLAAELFTSVINFGPNVGFSAAEIAAIILHELGHGITFVENLRNAFYRATEARDSVRLLVANGGPETLVHLVTDTEQRVAQLKDPKRQQGYQKLLDTSTDAADGVHTEIAAYIALDMLIGQVIMSGLLLCMAPFFLSGTFALGVINRLEKEVLAALAIGAGRGGKTSDIVNTLEQNASVSERIADEFVSRHGMGRPLAQALRKLSAYTSATPITAGKTLRAFLGMLTGMTSVASIVVPPPMAIPGATPYDAPLKRLALLVENNMAIFKDPHLPKALRDRWIAETEGLLKEAALARKTIWPEKARQFIWETLLRLSSAGSLTGMVVNANLQKDYAKLQDLTRHLIRNPLYFRAAQLQQKLDQQA